MKQNKLHWLLEHGTLQNDNGHYRYTTVKEYQFYIEAVGKILLILQSIKKGYIPNMIMERKPDNQYIYKLGDGDEVYRISRGGQ